MKDKTQRKPRQERRTHADTKENLQILRKFIRNKIKLNQGIFENEVSYFLDLFADSILSHGSFKITLTVSKYGRIDYKNLGNFAYLYIDACVDGDPKSNHVKLVDFTTGKSFYVEHKVVWEEILIRVYQAQTHILEEAIHMSPESQLREPPSSYEFSSEKQK